MAPYVKSSREPRRAQDVPAAIDRAWQLAQTAPSGPAFVSVPVDDWDAEAEPPALREPVRSARLLDVTDLAPRIQASARPAIVAGAGVDRDDAWDAVIELAERLGAPVWAAPQAPRAGFPEDHGLFQGHLAPGYRTAASQLAGHDLVLVLGAPVFAFLPYEPSAIDLPFIAQVTDDPEEAARAPAAVSLVGDIRGVVCRLLERLPAEERPGGASPHARPQAAMPEPSEPIAPAFLMATLGRLVTPDAVIVEESPSNRADFRRHVRIRRPRTFFTTASGGLGFALPAAVGIKLADPSRPVVCVVGDGSALYVPQALWSAVQLGLAVTFVIVNNARYAILDAAARFAGLEDIPGLELPGIDFVSLAASLGCRAERVTAPADLGEALAGALADDRPRLIDVTVDPAPPPLLPSVAQDLMERA
jgi:benzoylformate decarboxylase